MEKIPIITAYRSLQVLANYLLIFPLVVIVFMIAIAGQYNMLEFLQSENTFMNTIIYSRRGREYSILDVVIFLFGMIVLCLWFNCVRILKITAFANSINFYFLGMRIGHVNRDDIELMKYDTQESFRKKIYMPRVYRYRFKTAMSTAKMPGTSDAIETVFSIKTKKSKYPIEFIARDTSQVDTLTSVLFQNI